MANWPLYLLLVFYALALVFAVYSLYAMFSGAPFVPSSRVNVELMLEIARLKPDDILIDLGSGDGRILAAAAPYVRQAIGYEINPVLYYWSRWRLRRQRNVIVKRQSFWTEDLSGATVLTLFLITGKMPRLEKKLALELKSGTRVVSNCFRFPGWKPAEKNGTVYLYVVHSQ